MSRLPAVILAAVAILFAAAPAQAVATLDQQNLQVLAINPGLGNRVKGDAYFPVAVELAAQFEAARGEIRIECETHGESVPYYTVPYDLAPGSRYRYFLYPYCASSVDNYTIFIRDERGRILRQEELTMNAQPEKSLLVGILTAQGVPGIVKREGGDDGPGVEMAFISTDFMPPKARGYDMVDVLIWPHPDPVDLTPSQIAAVRDWVLGGGRLFLALGDTWQPASATFLKELVPGSVVGVRTLSDLSPLVPAGGVPFDSEASMVVAVLDNSSGRVMMSAGELPLVARGTAGFGEVTFVAFDPTRNPFARWEGARAFWDNLMGLVAEEGSDKTQPPTGNHSGGRYGGQYGAYGLSERIVSSINDFKAIKPVSFVLVVIFLMAYVILVGPVDYFVLKRLRHLEWTWFTFPVTALAATAVAFWLISSNRTARVYINQCSVADWSADGRMERGQMISAIISPRNAYYAISYGLPNCQMHLAQSSYGSWRMGSFGASLRFQVEDAPDAGYTARRMLLPIWSPRTFWGDRRSSDVSPPPMTLSLARDSEGAVSGVLANNTEERLANVAVITSNAVFRLGNVPPGKSVDVIWTARMSFDDFTKSLGKYDDPYRYYGGGTARYGFATSLQNLLMKATLDKDWRFYPLDNWRRWKSFEMDYTSQNYLFDLASETSMLRLIESGQAVALAVGQGAVYPLEAGDVSPVTDGFTIYRVCSEVTGSVNQRP